LAFCGGDAFSSVCHRSKLPSLPPHCQQAYHDYVPWRASLPVVDDVGSRRLRADGAVAAAVRIDKDYGLLLLRHQGKLPPPKPSQRILAIGASCLVLLGSQAVLDNKNTIRV